MGYPLATDDFSMAHTSLTYFQSNYFGLIKLDGSLVRGILENERNRDIIASIVYLAKSLKIDVLAEYVETKEQMETLLGIKCVLYQGYIYSQALDFKSFMEFLKKKKYSD